MSSGSIGIPQSNNLYAYVRNNPIDFVDPSGLNASATFFVCYDVITYGHIGDHSYAFATTVCHFFGGGGGTGGNPATDLDNGGGGGGGGGTEPPKEEQKECSVAPLNEITDPAAKRIEAHKGNYFDSENLTQAAKNALECLKKLVNPDLYSATTQSGLNAIERGNQISSALLEGKYKGRYWREESAYRPQAYQDHFRNILDTWKKLQHTGKECASLKAAVKAEKDMHGLNGIAGRVSRHSSGQGFDLVIMGVGETQITAYAKQCGLKRIFEKGEESHFNLP